MQMAAKDGDSTMVDLHAAADEEDIAKDLQSRLKCVYLSREAKLV